IWSLIGMIIAASPHVATLTQRGTMQFLADQDDVYYLAMTRAPYYGSLELTDPYRGGWEAGPVQFAWMQFVPLAKLTRLFGVTVILASLIGRVVGGCLLGMSLFVFFRRLFAGTSRPTAWALGCGIICLADAGFVQVQGPLFLMNFGLLGHLVQGTTP